MTGLKLHDLGKSREEIALERMREFAALPASEKMRRTIILLNTIRTFNNGEPIKRPQGKGFVFYKKNPDQEHVMQQQKDRDE